jgi:hypothetical protein
MVRYSRFQRIASQAPCSAQAARNILAWSLHRLCSAVHPALSLETAFTVVEQDKPPVPHY